MHAHGINCLKEIAKNREVCTLACPSGYEISGKSSFSCSEGDDKAIGKWSPDPTTEENKPKCRG